MGLHLSLMISFIFLFLSICSSVFLSLPLPQASNPLPPTPPHSWPGWGPAAHEGCSVQGHRVPVPTVPGLEHCLFVPMTLTSWPAGRLTLASPAALQDQLALREGASFRHQTPPHRPAPGASVAPEVSPWRHPYPVPLSFALLRSEKKIFFRIWNFPARDQIEPQPQLPPTPLLDP